MDPRLGGVLLGILLIILEYFGTTWDIGPSAKLMEYNFAMILGAFFSATLFKGFALKIPHRIELLKAIIAGILMGLGASLALGGNITAFFSPYANLSASALLMFLGIVVGIYIGVKYQVWELEKYPSLGATQIRFPKLNLIFALISLLILVYIIKIYWIFGIFAAIGFVLQRSRWCMLNAMKEPFFSEKIPVSQGVIIALAISTVGIGILKMKGIINTSLEVDPSFGWAVVLGGVLFGIGMMLAGAGTESLLWKLGEGDIKNFITLILFFAFYKIGSFAITNRGKTIFKGKVVFLPDYLNYVGTFILLLGVLALWYVFLLWNQKTKKFIKRYF